MTLISYASDYTCTFCATVNGGAENARLENDGQILRNLENTGLENYEQSFSKLRTKLRCLKNDGPLFASPTSRKKDASLHDEAVTDVVQCLLDLTLLPAHDIVDALQDIHIIIAMLPTDYTAVIFGNW